MKITLITTLCLAFLPQITGCVPAITSMIVSTPNQNNPLAGKVSTPDSLQFLMGIDQQFHVPVGPPKASIAVSIIEPDSKSETPRGTILVVHGIHARGFWMLSKAKTLASHGYRAVLVDLRGHGNSTGDFLTYGVREARDLSQVIDALYARDLITGKIGVQGISYGATTSIHLAAIDPRISAVVAIAPFRSMHDAVPHYVRQFTPGVGWLISDETFQKAIRSAGQYGRFDPKMADAGLAIQAANAPVLLLHGTWDMLVPVENSKQIHAAAPGKSQLVLMPGHGHSSIWVDPFGEVEDYSLQWFDRWLAR